MKKINYILIFLAIANLYSCKAQVRDFSELFTIENESGKYFKDLNGNFTPFLGTWEADMGNNQFFRVHLLKKKHEVDNYYQDSIDGWYELVEVDANGQVVQQIYTSQVYTNLPNNYIYTVINAYSLDGEELTGD